jgi:hypothetical protein
MLSRLRAYQTSGHLLVAVAHAFIIDPTSGVDTSAHAICGSVLTLMPLLPPVSGASGAYEGNREEKVPYHGRTS